MERMAALIGLALLSTGWPAAAQEAPATEVLVVDVLAIGGNSEALLPHSNGTVPASPSSSIARP